MLTLPEEWEQQLCEEIAVLEEEEHRPYLSYVERVGYQKGQLAAEQTGERRVLESLLRRRFGNVPEWVEKRLLEADAGLLEDWAVKVLDAESLEEIFSSDASPAELQAEEIMVEPVATTTFDATSVVAAGGSGGGQAVSPLHRDAFLRLDPWVESGNAGGIKVCHVPCNDDHAVYQRSCCDQAVAHGTRIGDMDTRASLGNDGIHGQDSARKRGQHMSGQPCSQQRALNRVTAFRQQYADLQLLNRDHRQIQFRGIHAVGPRGHVGIRLPAANLTQFRHDVGIK